MLLYLKIVVYASKIVKFWVCGFIWVMKDIDLPPIEKGYVCWEV
jgi:hypothetical protein